ncbi:MAG: hypothetical protein MI919_18200, partial [Holophagales bacterium]|nr:hypothetical protein [Holophagales bacterium]
MARAMSAALLQAKPPEGTQGEEESVNPPESLRRYGSQRPWRPLLRWPAVAISALLALPAFAGDEEPEEERLLGDGAEPAVASSPSGASAAVWEAKDADGSGIEATLFDATGAIVAEQVPVNTTVAGSQSEPDVAVLPNGNVVAVWQSADTGTPRILAQILDPFGMPIGFELQVNENGAEAALLPSIGADAQGNFVVAWAGASGGGYLHRSRPFSSLGMPIGFELAFGNTPGPTAPSVAVQPSGDHLVVWDDGGTDVRGRLYDIASMPIGFEL